MLGPEEFASVINAYLPEPHSSLLNGIIFGLPLRGNKIFYEQVKMVGLLHLVVLSGINITMLTAIVSSFLGFLSKPLSSLITILIIILFIFFVGPQAPIIRAAVMGILTLVAIIYGKNYLVFLSLLFSVFVTAIFWPAWLKTVSFQLSYGATLGILLFGTRNDKTAKSFLEKIFNQIKKELRLTLSAQVFTAPIIFVYFKQISIIAPLSNLLVSGLVPPLMIFGFLAAFLGKINFYLGLIPAYLAYGLLSYMIWVIEILTKIPFIYFKF
ncbi:MAG: ComEC/Rec2 family competence protein [Microgenomates group bacterium]|nr:ComEC/Rec2 family competence protein [Microgenomates group bacterium]